MRIIRHEICHARQNIGKSVESRRITTRQKFDEYIRKHRKDEMDCIEKPTNDFEKRLYDDDLAGLTKRIEDYRGKFETDGYIDVPVSIERNDIQNLFTSP